MFPNRMQEFQRLKGSFSYCINPWKPLTSQEIIACFDPFRNNAGDPFTTKCTFPNTNKEEIAVVQTLTKWITRGMWDSEASWGVCLPGSSLCLQQALSMAQHMYPTAVVFYSADSHYAVVRSAAFLKMGMEKVSIVSLERPEMDVADLERRILARGVKEVVVVATVGTTIANGCDQIHDIVSCLEKLQGTGEINSYYIHVDGAACGLVTPFLEEIPWNLSKVHSFSVSLHKMWAVPFPVGVFICKKEIRKQYTSLCYDSRCIRCEDPTPVCSRGGHLAHAAHLMITNYSHSFFVNYMRATIQKRNIWKKHLEREGIACYNDHPASVMIRIKAHSLPPQIAEELGLLLIKDAFYIFYVYLDTPEELLFALCPRLRYQFQRNYVLSSEEVKRSAQLMHENQASSSYSLPETPSSASSFSRAPSILIPVPRVPRSNRTSPETQSPVEEKQSTALSGLSKRRTSDEKDSNLSKKTRTEPRDTSSSPTTRYSNPTQQLSGQISPRNRSTTEDRSPSSSEHVSDAGQNISSATYSFSSKPFDSNSTFHEALRSMQSS